MKSPVSELIIAAWLGSYWALAGAYGWTAGVAAAWQLAGPDAWPSGGVLGLACAAAVVLATTPPERRGSSEYLMLGLAAAGGGTVAGLLAIPAFGTGTATVLIVVVGLVVGLFAAIFRPGTLIASAAVRAVVGLLAGGVAGLIGWSVGGVAGWACGGTVGMLIVGVAHWMACPPEVARSEVREVARFGLTGLFAGVAAGLAGPALAGRATDLGPGPGVQAGDPALHVATLSVVGPSLLLFAAVLSPLFRKRSEHPTGESGPADGSPG